MLLFVRIEQTLYFANCGHVLHKIERKMEEKKKKKVVF
jgi:MFS superfamily sulfate permease-like transporter